jgi:hypothetical protein
MDSSGMCSCQDVITYLLLPVLKFVDYFATFQFQDLTHFVSTSNLSRPVPYFHAELNQEHFISLIFGQ